MRVIGGARRGFRLRGERAGQVRPITDRAKEALFDILGNLVWGARVLDLFAGTGALGIEALSRGAEGVVFVEIERGVLTALQRNLERIGYVQRAEILANDAYGVADEIAARGPFDLAFIDPPYADSDQIERGSPLARLLEAIAEGGALKPDAVVVLRVRKGSDAECLDFGLGPPEVRRYGHTVLLVYWPIGAGKGSQGDART
jgi:16S rRNA (guanine966-N2)-methyltransferase